MGKIGASSKNAPQSKPTRVFKEASICKPVYIVRRKRLEMIKRRLNAHIKERDQWLEQNKNLADSLRAEKLITASLKKEALHWQRLYHESAISTSSHRGQQLEVSECLSLCLRDIDTIFPHIVGISEYVSTTKIRLSNLLRVLSSSDYSSFKKRVQDMKEVTDEYKGNGKPRRHKVGPMIKGHQIDTKPKIMIERLRIPQSRNQEQVNDDTSHIEGDHGLSPIPEERDHVEEPCFRHVSVRPRRTKLGKSWKSKKQEKLINVEREKVKEKQFPYNGDSSESDDIPMVVDMEADGRFKDISHLITSSSLEKVEAVGKNADVDGISRPKVAHNFHINTDDPLEGSSWMYTNRYQPSQNERRSSLYKSDSSDDDDDDDDDEALLVGQKSSNLLSANTLRIENQTLNNSTNNKNPPKSGSHLNNSNHTASCQSPVEEPDSTNNDSEFLNKISISPKHLASSSPVSSSKISSDLSTDYGSGNSSVLQQLSNQDKMPRVRLSKFSSDVPSSKENSSHSSRMSDVCDSPSRRPDRDSGKRVRKPANHRYPSEDYVISNVKAKRSKIVRTSVGRKSLTVSGKNQIKDSNHKQRRPSENGSKSNDSNTQGCDEESTNPCVVNGTKIRKSSKTGASVPKKSIATPVNLRKSSVSHLSGSEESSRPRRNKSGNVCYKEPSLNVKKRRP